MTRRILIYLLASCLVLTACTGDTAETTTTSTTLPPTTTTVPPTTTTTLPELEVAGAPLGLVELVRAFYDYAAGVSTSPPVAAPKVVEAITPGDRDVPLSGTAFLGLFKDDKVAVVEADDDFFLTVNDGTGWRIIGGEWPSLEIPAIVGQGPRHVAVVGSDARPGEDVASTRADSIHFVALDGEGSGAVVGLPRDSYISVPGFGRRKITTSLSLGGPEVMMEAFTDLTGLPLEGYVLTGFSGFEELLGSVLGGVTVEVPFAINDRWAHVNLSAGVQDLDGAEALGFARARKTVPGGDFTRSEHQGVILLGAAAMVKQMGMTALPALMEQAEPHLMTDLSAEDLFTFSAMALAADLDSIPNLVAPGSPGSAGSASVVFLANSAEDLWADLADGRLDP